MICGLMRLLTICFLLCAHLALSTGSVIILQGTSSAGKSSIALQLQFMLPGEWSIVAIDDFLGLELVDKAVHEGLIIDGMSELECQKIIADNIPKLFACFDDVAWNRVKSDTYNFVAQQVLAGRNVILDSVLAKEEFNADSIFMTLVKNIPLYMVLVYCSPACLIEHTNARNSCGDFTQARDLRRVLDMFCDLYVPVLDNKDQGIAQLTDIDLVDQRMREQFGSVFPVFVRPAYGVYDCIVNTGFMSVKDCAKSICQNFYKI